MMTVLEPNIVKAVLWIRIRMDPLSFWSAESRPHWERIWIQAGKNGPEEDIFKFGNAGCSLLRDEA
jgi:hypothetical protein